MPTSDSCLKPTFFPNKHRLFSLMRFLVMSRAIIVKPRRAPTQSTPTSQPAPDEKMAPISVQSPDSTPAQSKPQSTSQSTLNSQPASHKKKATALLQDKQRAQSNHQLQMKV
jgi:hypothetical protein